jgi:protein FAM98B
MGKPILKAHLSPKQWENVNFINQALEQEYECRREMLLKRLDVTIQSFRWSERVKVCRIFSFIKSYIAKRLHF